MSFLHAGAQSPGRERRMGRFVKGNIAQLKFRPLRRFGAAAIKLTPSEAQSIDEALEAMPMSDVGYRTECVSV